jgi:ribulose-phosphate 3-epimerase
MIEIIPSILTNDTNELIRLLSACEGVAKRVSIDVIDGEFANNKTIEPDALCDIETGLKIDYQLMVNKPISWVEKCVRGQADRIIGHIETMDSQSEFIKKVQEVGVMVGLGIDLNTPIEKVDPIVFVDLDVVLLMSVPAGRGGQEFREEAISKIEQLAAIRDSGGYRFKIHVDGGVTVDNIRQIRIAGADEVSVGKRIFEGDLKGNMDRFEKAAYEFGP